MVKDLPKVTIITPVYNRADLVKETIESILSQKYPNLEYIVINDGSTDDSLGVLKKYESKIKLISQKNMGETKTVNKGLSMAKGDLIAVVNSDDPLLPGSLFEVEKFMKENPSIIAGYPDWQVIDEKGNTKNKVVVKEYSYEYMFSRQHCIVGPGAFIRRKALRIVKQRNDNFNYVADFEFWLRLGLYGDFKRIPQTLATFRIHLDSQSHYAKGMEMAKEHVRLVDHIASLLDFPEELKKCINQAYSSAYFSAAKVSTSNKSKFNYYLLSFKKSPLIFAEKFKYDLVKLKHNFLSIFLFK